MIPHTPPRRSARRIALCLLPILTIPLQGQEKAPAPPPTPAKEPPAVPASADKPKHTNRLAKEKSPYLLQHAHNPVDWHPWGEEAFEKAKKENKPVLLSIGYSTCHWCHVMERESFESEELAKIINENFIAIKLDREERPDIDSIYMTAMQALQLGGGWPLNCFLTPERKPFYGGTYFRPPQFKTLLQRVAQLWKNSRADIENDAANITRQLSKSMELPAAAADAELKPNWVTLTAMNFADLFDERFGGFGEAPKFPQPKVPELILLVGAKSGNQELVDKVLFTCRRMAAGGIYDHLGGGFSRYSVDEKWLVPHFEKMLYDNGQLVELYLNAYLASGDARLADVARGILRYILRDMTHAEGGFYSAEDADSEGHEGKFYTWTLAEIQPLLGADQAKFAAKYFGLTEEGNFTDHSHPEPLKNQNVLSIASPEEKLSVENRALAASIQQKLLTARSKRIRPHLDDKILTSWNGLMLAGMARAGVVLEDDSYLDAARKNLAFVQQKMWDAKSRTLHHRYRDGERDNAQLLSAYAFYLHGVVELYQATLDPAHLDFAVDLADALVEKFHDPKAGGFFTSATHTDLLFRTKDDYDGAEPSGNSVAILALLKVSHLTGRKDLREKAVHGLKFFAARMEKMPQAVPNLLLAASFAMNEPYHVVISGDPAQPATRQLLRAAHQVYQPEKVVVGTAGKVDDFTRSIAQADKAPTAHVCTGQQCKLPTGKPDEVRKQLKIEPKKS